MFTFILILVWVLCVSEYFTFSVTCVSTRVSLTLNWNKKYITFPFPFFMCTGKKSMNILNSGVFDENINMVMKVFVAYLANWHVNENFLPRQYTTSNYFECWHVYSILSINLSYVLMLQNKCKLFNLHLTYVRWRVHNVGKCAFMYVCHYSVLCHLDVFLNNSHLKRVSEHVYPWR